MFQYLTLFLSLTVLLSIHQLLSQESLDVLLPGKVVPSLVKDAVMTPYMFWYAGVWIVGILILLLLWAAVAQWLSKAICCCLKISSNLSSFLAVSLVYATLISANTVCFPNSGSAIPLAIAHTILWCCIALFLYVTSNLLRELLFIKEYLLIIKAVSVPSLMVLLALPFAAYFPGNLIENAWGSMKNQAGVLESRDRPHVILIGIDSLRPDYTSLLGSQTATPSINEFLDNAVSFPEAYTPIARTFPAWLSILTAEYPWNVGAYFNLTSIDEINLSKSLPHGFKGQGYTTVFATDEKRFSNIDEAFGFDRVLGPVLGVADFLLGSLNDSALTNIFVNGLFGRIFFPFSHSNRAAYTTYSPNTFIRLLSSSLPSNPERPYFIATHLCLPHYPFIWKDTVIPGSEKNAALYKRALEAVDDQFHHLFELLKKKGYLDNALVVVFSDHGEGLGYSAGITSTGTKNIEEDTLGQDKYAEILGHGTSVLSANQYRVVLAFRRYGGDEWQSGERHSPVILTDIMPTIVDAADVSLSDSRSLYDGVSLLPTIVQTSGGIQERQLYIETGLNPRNINFIADEISAKAIQAGMGLYEIDPNNGRLYLKPEVIDRERGRKDYGIISNGKFLGIINSDSENERGFAFRNNTGAKLEFYPDYNGLPLDAKKILKRLKEDRPDIVRSLM